MPWGCFIQYIQLSLAGHLSLFWILIPFSFFLFNYCRFTSPHLFILYVNCSSCSVFQLSTNLHKTHPLFPRRLSPLHIFLLSDVMSWPWLDASCPPKPSITPLLSYTGERNYKERLMDWDKDGERPFTNYHHVKNLPDLGKLVYFIANQITVE